MDPRLNIKVTASNRKYLMYFVATILIEGLALLLADMEGIPTMVFKAIGLAVSLFWYYLITQRSGLFRTVLGRLLYLSVTILLIGALAKLEHWWFASYFLIIGMLSFGLIYLSRFILKKNKKLLDVVKLLFLALTLFTALSKLEHWSVEQFDILKLALFYSMLFLFAIEIPEVRDQREKFSFEEVEENNGTKT